MQKRKLSKEWVGGDHHFEAILDIDGTYISSDDGASSTEIDQHRYSNTNFQSGDL